MSSGPDFSEYDKRMEDREYRARLERTSLTEEEEMELYKSLDELLADDQVAGDGEPDAYSEAKFESLRNDDSEPDA